MSADKNLPVLCRECFAAFSQDARGKPTRCPDCASPRIVGHEELNDLAVAHIDCDAFYAAVEKRDDPSLADRPVIIGGGRRGVVATACYLARVYGVKSAMPMFKARAACPDAVVIRPNMEKYRAVGQEIRTMMRDLTPLVQPISIDEAFLDLTGTEGVHGVPAATSLAKLIKRIETKLGVTASVGLSYNKFLAKIASDLDKPRGFAVLGRGDALEFLAPKPVGLLWGVGRALASKLRRDGISQIGQLQKIDERDLVARYGSIGTRLYRFSRGEDDRKVKPQSETKSISSETTFREDIDTFEELKAQLQPLCHKVAGRLKDKSYAAGSVTLKLKRTDFQLLTRTRQLGRPTQRGELLYETALGLLEKESNGTAYRLIGVGAGDLTEAVKADPPDLFDKMKLGDTRLDTALNAVRDKHGSGAIRKGT
ncbi:MAG TPA: DNA polymerase IV [Rhodospirillaceae bacterium]|nr:DNA polymerase IV [Rhodospirillaceae bacterium]HAA93460.1 DNA polymerase IV [Rhodospirillaceae bacterium]HAT34928.1 DNA polymerase IV [Rhodospirillaceae bacterium]